MTEGEAIRFMKQVMPGVFDDKSALEYANALSLVEKENKQETSVPVAPDAPPNPPLRLKEARDIKKGDMIMIRGRPCKVMKLMTSKA